MTPSFNQGEYLEETIDSVLSQNYSNLEYIIVDGGSSDDSIEIIKRYSKYLHYWTSREDRGHFDALNMGFSKSTGDIMAWINSDDKYFPWAFETVSEIFSDISEVNWLTGLATRIDCKSRIERAPKVRKNFIDYLAGDYRWIQQESTFWSRDLWQRAGSHISSKYKLMVDGELWSRFFNYEQLWHVDLSLGAYRLHGTNRASLFSDGVEREMSQIVDALKEGASYSDLRKAKCMTSLRKVNKVLKTIGLEKMYIDLGYYPVVKEIEGQWSAIFEDKR